MGTIILSVFFPYDEQDVYSDQVYLLLKNISNHKYKNNFSQIK